MVTFMANFATIMLFGAVFSEHKELTKTTLAHEAVHVTQYQTLFSLGLFFAVGMMFACFAFDIRSWWMLSLILIPILLYYVYYGIEYLIRLIIYRDRDRAYRMIAFEQEAYDLQQEWVKPCTERRSACSFSFFKYYRNSNQLKILSIKTPPPSFTAERRLP